MTVHSSGKILVFKTIGILLPFLALVILELALRVFHYGDNVDLFVDYPADKQYLIFNPKASHKYFAGPGLATTGNQELFRKKKGTNVFRIFVLGESTTLGYPYFHNGSFHRWLQYRLMHTFPDTEFEVINLSLTAVNSWTVLGFAKELVDYSPDAVLIYSGHNEYYGALGVASTDNIAGNRLVIKSVLALRNLRFFQGITRLYARIRFSHSSQSGDTRMKSMVAEAMIPYGSELYNRGLTQFESNLKETLDVLNRHGVPVFVSTLVSNEKDFKPFVSGPEEGEPKKPDSDNAFNNYDLGQAAYAVGDFDDAKQYFSKARDLDGLRFRATGQVNQILSRLSNNYPNVKLVDAMAEFEAASPHHIIGDELMLEHVHPNLRGYGLLSDAFYRSIRPLFKLSRNAEEMTFQQLQRLMPITAVDSLAGAYKIRRLKGSWPFNEKVRPDTVAMETVEAKLAWQYEQKHIEWSAAMESLYSSYIRNGKLSNARKAIEALALEYPFDANLVERAAMIAGKMEDEGNALFYFKKAFLISPTLERAKYICSIYLQHDDPDNALPFLDYAVDHSSPGSNFSGIKTAAQHVLHLKNELKKDSANVSVLVGISRAYLNMGNSQAVVKYISKALTLNSADKEANLIRAQIAHMQRNN